MSLESRSPVASVPALCQGVAPTQRSKSLPPLECPSLSEIFELLSEQWARDFALNSDISEDLAALASPSQVAYAAVADFKSSTIDADAQHPWAANDFHLVNVFVPAYSNAHLSAEIVIPVERAASNPRWIAGHASGMFGRLLRCDDSGTAIAVLHDPPSDSVFVKYFRFLGTTARVFCWCRFRRSELIAALSHSFDVASAARTLVARNYAREFRPCLHCRAPPGTPRTCGCSLGLKRAAHSLDFSHSRPNMLIHVDSFSGHSEVALFAGGVPISCAQRLLVQTRVSISAHGDEARRLCEHAAFLRMNALSTVPMPIQTDLPSASRLLDVLSVANHADDAQTDSTLIELASNADPLESMFDQNIMPISDFPKVPNLSPNHCATATLLSAAILDLVPDKSTSVNLILDDDALKARRAMERKISNRASAARSNEKRRLKNLALKRDLAHYRTLKKQLDLRKAALLEENQKLQLQLKENMT